MQRSAMRRCLKGLGGRPTSTDGFILGPSHGTVGRLAFLQSRDARARTGLERFLPPPVRLSCNKILLRRIYTYSVSATFSYRQVFPSYLWSAGFYRSSGRIVDKRAQHDQAGHQSR